MVIDLHSREIGLLIERYDVFEGFWKSQSLESGDSEIGPIYAWEILWSGGANKSYDGRLTSRHGSYTEMGLISLIRDGQFDLIKKDDSGAIK